MANNDYITTDCKLTVSKNTAKLDEEIFLYKNDRNIKLLIEIVDNKYRYKSDDLSNLLVKYKASYAQVKWYKNAEVKKEFPIQATDDGKVVFVIEGQLIDEDTELGDYDLQLRLLNESQESIRSLPIIKGAVHILKPLFEEGDIATVNSAVADVSMLSLDGDAIDTYNSDGTYNQTNWGNGDVISSAKLNKLEKVAKDNVDKVNKMPAKSIVEGGKIYLAKEDGTKLDSGTELPAGGSTIEVVNNLESDSTTAALSAAQGKALNTQYKDIVNYSLVKHTDGKVYIKKQDGTLIGTGVEVGSDTDLSKVTMSMSGQTLKLMNDGAQIATVEIPTAVVTDEQLTNIIQAKIDDGTLGALAIENGSIGAEKTNFITNEHINILNYDECKEKVGINITTGEEEGTINWGITGYIPVEYGTIYYIYFNKKYETTSLCQYDENKTFLEGSADYIENTLNITNSNTKYIRFKASGLSSIVVTKDSSCTEYIPYSKLRLTGFSNEIKQLLNKNTSENFNALSTDYFNSAKKIVTPASTTFLIEEPLNYIDVSKLIADKVPASTGINNMITWNGKYCSNIVELTGDGTYYCDELCGIRFYNNEEVDITPSFTASNPTYHGYVKFEINEGTLTVYGDSASDGIVTAIAENVNVKYARFGTTNNTSPMVTKDEKYTTYYDFKYKILKIDDNYKETFAKYILDNTNIVKDRVNKAINPLYGKTWLSLGDSITQYFKDGNYMDIVKNNLCLGNYKTYALAGALWENGQKDASTTDIETTTSKGTSFGQYNLMKADIDGGIVSPDIITIALGTNCTNVGEFWTDESTHTVNTDTTTMCGAMHVILQKIMANYTNENIRIGGIIPPQAKGRSSEISESTKTKLNLIRRIYEFYSIPYLDLEKEGYIIDSNIANNGTLGDGLHPSALGNKLYARKITNFIKNL